VRSIRDEQIEYAGSHRNVAEENGHCYEREGNWETQQNNEDKQPQLEHADFRIGHRATPTAASCSARRRASSSARIADSSSSTSCSRCGQAPLRIAITQRMD